MFVVDATALARFCPTDGGSAGNFASIHDAIAATQAGGTIVVCDGAHEVSSAIVDRPLTVAAERPHAATLTTSGPLPILRVINSSPGTTTIRDLTFVKNGGGVALDIGTGSSTPPAGRYDQVMVENNRFTLSVPHGLGVRITPSEIGTAKVTIRGSTFTGGWRGVWAQAAAAVDVLGNTFSAQVPGTFEHNASVEFTDGGPYTVRNNVVTDCPLHCIQVRSVVANISDNTLETTVAATTLDGISIFAGTTTVARNIIRGIGEVVRRDDHNAYAFKTAGIRIALEGTATLTENTITNANYGITTLLGATVTGSDNTVTVTFAPVPLTASGPHLHRNDFTDYIGAAVAGDAPAGALSCNYWGPNGPFIPTGMEHVFTPFSLVPIANKPVACP